jgi:hypothetical protein
MSVRWESFKVRGEELLGQVKRLVHEGNVRRIRIRQGGRLVAEFPLTVGVVGTVGAPALAALGAIAALLTRCSIDVERVSDDGASRAARPSAGPKKRPRRKPSRGTV